MPFKKTKTLLSVGLTVVFTLTTFIGLLSLSLVYSSFDRTEQAFSENYLKSELVVRMRSAARERTVSLQKMALMKTASDRDEEWLRFEQYSNDFREVRKRLVSFRLSDKEHDLLEKEAVLSDKAYRLQMQVVELMRSGRMQQAYTLLLLEAMHVQDQTFSILTELLELQKDNTKIALKEDHLAYGQMLFALIVLAGIVAILSIFIVSYLVRRVVAYEQQLHEEKERALVTLYSIGDGVITTDAVGNVIGMNAVAEQLTGWRTFDALNKPLREVFPVTHEADGNEIDDLASKELYVVKVLSSDGDRLLVRPDGQESAIEYTIAPVFDHDKRLARMVLVFRDVTEMRTLSRQLAYQACHDMLTDLYNRREFEANLEQALAEVRRYNEVEHWLCYIDMDQFKVINDTCGHVAGDELLKQVAATLSRQVREVDLVARMGGDEFAVLLRRCPKHEALKIVERILHSFNELQFHWDDKSFSTSASIGVVPINAHSGSVNDLLSAADTACYVSKDGGRNRLHIYQQDDDITSHRESEMHMVSRIRQALDEERLVLYCQHIKPLQDVHSFGYLEILVRMLDERGVLIPPMAFIPPAERYNLMSEIDCWVIKKAFQVIADNAGRRICPDCIYSINLSAQSLNNEKFLSFLKRQLKVSAVNPGQICFEITETSAIANLSRAIELINAIKTLGCRFSLDDFGSGLSSFGYLKNLPVDSLKIDGSFIRDILDDPMDLAFVRSINQIGHVMGIQTIAEYVDSKEKSKLLKELGVDYVQGFAIHKPEPLEDMVMAEFVDQSQAAGNQ